MNHEQLVTNYAKLLVYHGLGIQAGQDLAISCEAVHRELALQVLVEAYRAGARHVAIELTDPRFHRARILEANPESLDFVPAHISVKYSDLVASNGANLKILGSEFPEALEGLPPELMNRSRVATYNALKPFYQHGIGESKVHWTVAAAATPDWGKRVFPELGREEALMALWNEIFKICRVDQPNFLDRWQTHNKALHDRATFLTAKSIQRLSFRGPGLELDVGLSEHAVFKGGSDTSPRGAEFEPNIPTEEVFTTPDWRRVDGTLRATRPFLVNGTLIKGLTVLFKSGEIAEFDATEGRETFARYIESDPGAKRLGEVALVDTTSPVFQSGRVFEEILFDENAACHVAIGSAYKFCIKDFQSKNEADFVAIGCNESSAHTDIMISDENTDVFAVTWSGENIPLIEKGRWATSLR